MDEDQRRPFAGSKPAVAKLHQRAETRIKIEAHFGELVLLALSDVRRDLPENLQPRQLSQAVGQRGARDVEGGAKGFECPRAEEGLANDEKRPGVRNNVEGPRHRAVSLAPGKTCAGCSRRNRGRRPQSRSDLGCCRTRHQDCIRPAGSRAARNVGVMLYPSRHEAPTSHGAPYTTPIDLEKKVSLVMLVIITGRESARRIVRIKQGGWAM